MRICRQLVMGALLLSWGPLPAQARPEPHKLTDPSQFYEYCGPDFRSGEYARAAAWARLNPRAAKDSYKLWCQWMESARSDEANRLFDSRFLTMLAQELAKQGDASALSDLRRRGWYQPDMAEYRPAARLEIDQANYAPCNRLLELFLQQSSLFASLDEVGGTQVSSLNAQALADYLAKSTEQKHLLPLDQRAKQIKQFVLDLPVSIEVNRGNSAQVDEKQALHLASDSRDGGASLLYALHQNASPARLQSLLAESRRLGWGKKAGLADFVYRTYEADLYAQRDKHVKAEELLKLHNEAIASLQKASDLSQSDLPGHEMVVWFELLARQLDRSPSSAKIQAVIGQDLALLQKISETEESSPSLWLTLWFRRGEANAAFLKQRWILLELARIYLAVGRVEQARQVLALCGDRSFFQRAVERDFSEIEAAMIASADDLKLVKSLGIQLQPVNTNLRDGFYARLLEEWCTLEMALDPGGPNFTRLFGEAEQFGQRARPNLGWMGFDDPRWLYLDHLFKRRPEGWSAQAGPILDGLQGECDRLVFRPGQARVLAYRAEIDRPANPARALQELSQAVGLIEGYLNELSANPGGRAQLREAYQPIYSALAQLQIERGSPDQAFETLQRQQQAEAVNRNSAALAGDPKAESLMRVRSQTKELEAQFQANARAGRDNSQTAQLLAQNKAEFHTVLTDLRKQYPSYESALAIRPTNFSKSQKYLPTDVAIVQYFPTDQVLYIFVVTHEKLIIRQVPIAAKELNSKIDKTLLEMFKPAHAPQPSYAWNGAYSKSLREGLLDLHQVLITPMEQDLAGIKVLAFIPTGSLSYLPFSALARARGEGLEFLVERYPCVNLVKSSDLESVGRPPVPEDGGLLALGNPDGSLPGAEREVAGVASQFTQVTKLLGAQATSAQLQQIGAGTRYIHLATHGILDSVDPKKSYLLVSGKPGSNHLTMPEIYDLKLDGVRLVTLSACETAREGGTPGSEISSLAEAFSVAGTNSVVASLWSVSDEATEKLMVEFYKGLHNKHSLASSLQEAELSVMKNPSTAHPFFWAPFLVLGDWR